MTSDTYECIEYLGVRTTREEECVFNVNIGRIDGVLVNRGDCAEVIGDGEARQSSPQIPGYCAILRLNIGEKAQTSSCTERITTYRNIKQCTMMYDHCVCV